MNEAEQKIFSSTGSLGVSRRPFERLYVNGIHGSDNISEFDRNYRRLLKIADRHPEKIGRSVFRGVVSEDVYRHIQNEFTSQIEAALPLSAFTGDSSLLIYLGNNQLERRQIYSTEQMVADTKEYRTSSSSLFDRLQASHSQGFSFVDNFSEEQVDQLYALWNETFGWQASEINNLRKRLNNEKCYSQNDRSVWFSATQNKGEIISAAMAERLTIPTLNNTLDLVESTEWKTLDGCEGKGLMTGTLALLNAQILSSSNAENNIPLIYAECNYLSRSDRAANGASFTVPPRVETNASQILRQHVGVKDGHDGSLRDFTVMWLSKGTIDRVYTPLQVTRMLSLLSQ